MELSVLEKSALFSGVPAGELREALEAVPHRIQRWDKGGTVFALMEEADRIGIVLSGRVQAQKPFPNGSQINVSVRGPGGLIGLAAAFSRDAVYPCDVVALESAEILMLRREAVLALLQKDARILGNFLGELATTTYRLQQRLELLSYSGIAQKAACYLLIRARQSGKTAVRIPGSISNWAMILNVSRPSLHRELKKLEAEGILSCDPPRIKIRDPEALERVLSR